MAVTARVRRRSSLLVVSLLAGLLAGPLVATPARSAPPCQNPGQPGNDIPDISWHQKWFAPERIWPFTRGGGVTVAVIDSGVDAAHPQLAGKVAEGFDIISNTPGGNLDCNSHGTAVASLIAASKRDGIGLVGLAPDVRVLPVRLTENQPSNQEGGPPPATPAQFAQAIRFATDNGAKVINMSVTLYSDDPGVAAAIRAARAKNIVMVAAAGNFQDGTKVAAVPYPAAYEGVIGVGSIDESGNRDPKSQIGSYVDLVAPGVGVVAAMRQRGHRAWTGTSFATPMVAASAALVRAYEPQLTADQVAQRLIATADPARGGPYSEAYGYGVVNPYRAVTERPTADAPVAAPPLPELARDPVAEARADRWRTTTIIAVTTGLVLTLIVVGALIAAVVVPRGRARRWRPGRAAPPPSPPRSLDERDGPDDPESLFFVVPGPQSPQR